MVIISHRGNIGGADPEVENKPEQIDLVIEEYGWDVEVDLWKIGDKFFLGHDEPQYEVTWDWLWERSNSLWIHCKNGDALIETYQMFNTFWHQKDDYTLTSTNWIWAYPGIEVPEPARAIAVMPEENFNVGWFGGVCTDNPEWYA